MNIKQVQIENFMRVKLARITPDGAVVQIAGNNEQGKTSIVLAVIAALGGKKQLAKALGLRAAPTARDLIRRGEEMAKVVVALDDYAITWKRTAEKETVEIRGADGGRHGRGKLLELVGPLAFDPMEFDGMPAGEKRRVLLELVGVDLGDLESKRKSIYQRRRDANRDYNTALARIGPAVEGAPEEPVDVGALRQDLDVAVTTCQGNSEARREAVALGELSDALRQRCDDVSAEADRAKASFARCGPGQKKELAKMKSRHAAELEDLARRHQHESKGNGETIVEIEERRSGLKRSASEAAATANRSATAAGELVDPDLDPIRADIKEGGRLNALYELTQARIKRHDDAEEVQVAAVELHVALAEIDDERAKLLAAAKMPIEGLGIDDDGVTFGGNPLEQESMSRRIRICVAIASALNPELKIAMVRNGNDLDKKTFAAFGAYCEEVGLQAWVERIEPVGGGAIVIEEGLVKA